jgi:TRAP-type C4-dicarboxylate transport system substrate-binding protein
MEIHHRASQDPGVNMTERLSAAGYQGPSSILSASMSFLCERLEEEAAWTQGVDWTPNVTVAGESAAELFASVEAGTRQLCYMASGYLSERVPELQLLDIPFSVGDRTRALSLLDGQAGLLLKQAVEHQTAFKVLGFWDNGFRHFSNALRPLHHPDDVQGMRVRTLDSALYRESLQAMGFQAVTSDVKELVQWVRTGQVQAQENPLTNFLGFELWRHHPHVSLSGHFWGVLLLLCPMAWYQKLSKHERLILDQVASQATAMQRQLAAQEDAKALGRLGDCGVRVIPPEAMDLEAFRARVSPVRRRMESTLPEALVRAYLALS